MLTACKEKPKDKVGLRAAVQSALKLLKTDGIKFDAADILLKPAWKRTQDALKFQ